MGHACTSSKSDTFDSGGHFYGHFVNSEKLSSPQEITCSLADPRLNQAVRAFLMGVACGSVPIAGTFLLKRCTASHPAEYGEIPYVACD